MPRIKVFGKCKDCKAYGHIKAHGFCHKCYNRKMGREWYRKKNAVPLAKWKVK
jgi:hypothetical protein